MTPAPAQRLPTTIEFPEELHGRRVVLRPYAPDDAAALKDAVEESRESLRPWMPWWNTHQTLEESVDFCVRSRARWLLRENMNAGVWDRSTGRYLGGSGFHDPDWRVPKLEIGYWLRTSAVGHGYMTEAVQVLTRAAFEVLDANRVEIRCDSRNTRSRAVAERCGYVLEGTLRRDAVTTDGQLRDTLVFGLVREEFEALLPTWSDSLPA
ncbi:MAG TPA: GNAT family protein [Chloroflexota bacterium]|nr:GNAT family protein [Chloroflexota bacterium]